MELQVRSFYVGVSLNVGIGTRKTPQNDHF